MGRKLKFQFPESEALLECEIEKVSRDRIYGKTVTKAKDANGNVCELVTIDADGMTLIGAGGYAQKLMSKDGSIVDRSETVSVDEEDIPYDLHKSSFNKLNELVASTPEELLSHTVKSAYHLNESNAHEMSFAEGKDDLMSFADVGILLSDGSVFKMDFSYSDGIIRDTAFLVANEGLEVFLLITTPLEIEFLEFEDKVQIDEEIEEGDDEDFLDFEGL